MRDLFKIKYYINYLRNKLNQIWTIVCLHKFLYSTTPFSTIFPFLGFFVLFLSKLMHVVLQYFLFLSAWGWIWVEVIYLEKRSKIRGKMSKSYKCSVFSPCHIKYPILLYNKTSNTNLKASKELYGAPL